MSDFEKYLAETLKMEGGYVNDPDDRGGETFRGVAYVPNKGDPVVEQIFAKIAAAKKAGHTTAKAIDAHFRGDREMAALVADFYRKNYWEVTK